MGIVTISNKIIINHEGPFKAKKAGKAGKYFSIP